MPSFWRRSRTRFGQDDLSEEYYVFQFGPDALPQAGNHAWLAGMVHLES